MSNKLSQKLWIGAFGALVFFAGNARAQAPAGSTGVCKDGTYSNAPKKAGACSGHKGVQTWYSETPAAAKSAPAPAPAPVAAKSAPAPAPAPMTPMAPKPSPATAAKSSPSTMAQAPGGGPGMVWVNTASKVYHCSGTTYYGKTKAGKYMTEAAAKAEGDRADAGKACTR
jgi:hypothetical protein